MNLDNELRDIFRVLPAQENGLKKLGIVTTEDLLYHFPTRYVDAGDVSTIGDLHGGISSVIFGKISGLKTSKAFYKKIPMAEGWVEDSTGKIKIIWFHQAYLAKMITEGSYVRVV